MLVERKPTLVDEDVGKANDVGDRLLQFQALRIVRLRLREAPLCLRHHTRILEEDCFLLIRAIARNQRECLIKDDLCFVELALAMIDQPDNVERNKGTLIGTCNDERRIIARLNKGARSREPVSALTDVPTYLPVLPYRTAYPNGEQGLIGERPLQCGTKIVLLSVKTLKPNSLCFAAQRRIRLLGQCGQEMSVLKAEIVVLPNCFAYFLCVGADRFEHRATRG